MFDCQQLPLVEILMEQSLSKIGWALLWSLMEFVSRVSCVFTLVFVCLVWCLFSFRRGILLEGVVCRQAQLSPILHLL